jgi:serine/threonine protein kinase
MPGMTEEQEKDNLEPGNEDRKYFPTISRAELVEELGTQIGPYKLLSILGEGGFGIVYRAEQKEPVRRQVALKVIKPGMDSKQVIGRFEVERQALALLDHPNIAHVFDAGTTEGGRPYFVMEYVKGVSFTEHCDQQKLSIEERLELFMQICNAVQYAHQKGIIHRDIKPPNILVSVEGEKETPKIIDFGVAKAITQPLTDRTLFTVQGQLIGTPEYMSPEQADISPRDIDTRSDIYSLGVLLYELLTGVLPFKRKTLEEAGLAEIQRIIREEDPPRPSTRLSSLGENAEKAAKLRRTEATSLAKKLQKELEWIPLKAMRKERTHRYRTASELADDIRNYLQGDPLIAGPPSSFYRIKKYVLKYRTASIVITLLLVILCSTCAISLYFYSETRYNFKKSELKTEAYKTQAKKILTFTNQIALASFLELWYDEKMARAKEFSVYIKRKSPEKTAVLFLLDPRPLVEKEAEYRVKLSKNNPGFWEFIIGEYHLKNKNIPAAIEAYKRCVETSQTASELDDWFINRAKRKLGELLSNNSLLESRSDFNSGK